MTSLAAYEREHAAWEASRPETRLVAAFRNLGAELATAGVRDGMRLQLSARDFEELGREVEHSCRLPRGGTAQPVPPDVSIHIETACGCVTVTCG